MGSYSEFKEVVNKYDINVTNFCSSSGITIEDIEKAEGSGVLPSFIELSLIRYVEYLKENSIFTRACKRGLRIKEGKIIINPFDDNPDKLDGFSISDDEKKFVTFVGRE